MGGKRKSRTYVLAFFIWLIFGFVFGNNVLAEEGEPIEVDESLFRIVDPTMDIANLGNGRVVSRLFAYPREVYVDQNGEYALRGSDWRKFDSIEYSSLDTLRKGAYSYFLPDENLNIWESVEISVGTMEYQESGVEILPAAETLSKEDLATHLNSTFVNTYPDIDVVFTDSRMFRERKIILKNKPANLSPTEELIFWEEYFLPERAKVFVNDIELYKESTSGEKFETSIRLKDGQVFNISPAIIFDFIGNKKESLDQIVVHEAGENKLKIGIKVKADYLLDYNLVYPVTIDPIYNYCAGTANQNSTCDITELRLETFIPFQSNGASNVTYNYNSVGSDGSTSYSSLYKFNADWVGIMGNGATINNAYLRTTFHNQDFGSGNLSAVAYGVTQPWTSVNNINFSSTTNGEITQDANFFGSNTLQNTLFNWQVRDMVRDWYTGARVNYGINIRPNGSWTPWNNFPWPANNFQFYSGVYGSGPVEVLKRPYIQVDYTLPNRSDLIISAATVSPNSIQPSTNIQVNSTIENIGPVGASNAFSVAYYLSDDLVLDTQSDILLDEHSTNALASGATRNLNRNIFIPSNTSPGSKNILLVVDSQSQITEANETNNQLDRSLLITGPPDLNVSDATIINPNLSYFAGDQISLSVRLRNGGTSAANNVNHAFYLQNNSSGLTYNLNSISPAPDTSYAPGYDSTITFTGTIPSNLPYQGDYRIIFELDSNDNILETNEFNNLSQSNNVATIGLYSTGGGPSAVQTSPSIDSDSDGATNQEETELGTDLANSQKTPYEANAEVNDAVVIDKQEGNHFGDPINLRTGGFEFSQTDFVLPGRGEMVNFSRVYNSKRAERTGRFGRGWDFSYDRAYYLDPNTGNVILFQGGAVVSRFIASTDAQGNPIFLPAPGEKDSLYYANNTLVYETLAGVRYIYSNQLTNNLGLLTSIVDTNGNTTTLSYINLSNVELLSSITDPSGRQLNIVYGASTGPLWDKIVEMNYTVDVNNYHKFSYSYDNLDRLTTSIEEVMTAGSLETSVDVQEYDASHQMTKHTDPRGTEVSNIYDASGRVTDQYEYNPDTDMTGTRRLVYALTYSDQPDASVPGSAYCNLGHSYDNGQEVARVKACFNGEHLRIFSQDLSGNSAILSRNLSGLITASTDQNNQVTQYQYDSRRRKVLDIFPNTLDWHTEIAYTYENNFNRVTQKVETATSLSNPSVVIVATTTYAIDPNTGNTLSITDPMGGVESFVYDSFGNVTSYTDKRGNVTSYVYDTAGNYLLSESILITKPDNSTETITKSYAYDAFGNKISYTDGRGNAYTYTYDNDNNLLTETDPLGGTRTYEYDNENHRTAAIDELGRRTNYSYTRDINASLVSSVRVGLPNNIATLIDYDYLGRIELQTDPNSNVTSFTYDNAGRLYQKQEPAGLPGQYVTTTYLYDGVGNLTRESNSLGERTDYIYDSRNQLVETRYFVDTTGYISEFNLYDGLNRLIQTIKGNGNITTKNYDLNNRLISETDALGNTMSYIYDADGNVVGEIHPRASANPTDLTFRNSRGHSMSYDYDEKNRKVREINADDKVTLYFYDGNDNLISLVDRQNLDATQNSHITTYTYDALNRKTSETDAFGNLIGYGYDLVGNKVSSTDELGNVTIYVYDDFDRLEQEIDATGGVTRYSYDNNGNRTGVVYPDNTSTTLIYDTRNRLISITDELGNIISMAYDARGNKISETDKRGYTTIFQYDLLNRLTQEINPAGTVTTYGYDNNGNRLSQNADGVVTAWQYDVLNRLTTTTHPGNNLEVLAYDEEGNVVSKTDGNNTTITYSYDNLNRLSSKNLPDETNPVSYNYDNWDNRIDTIQETHSTRQFFDNLNRLVREEQTFTDLTGQIKTTQRTYDAVGNLRTLTDVSGKLFTYTYNNVNLLVSVTYNSQVLATYAYDSRHRPTNILYANNVDNNYTYDALGRVDTFGIVSGTGTLYSHDYSYDAVGNRLSLAEGVGDSVRTINYTYDTLEQLTGVDYTDVGTGVEYTYAYDQLGNRTSYTTPFENTTYTLDPNSRELSQTSVNSGVLNRDYIYNGNGSLTQEVYTRLGAPLRTVTYSYTSENRLAGMSVLSQDVPIFISPQPTSQAIWFAYDDVGNRIRKTVNGQNSYYVNNGLSVLNELDSTGTTTKTLVPGLATIAEINSQGEVSFVHTDALGSTVLVTDINANILAEYEYEAFGGILGTDGTYQTDYLYTGQELDLESELYYYNSRYYNPTLGRFIQRDDRIGYDGDVLSKNRYTYVKNNPLKYVDPTGGEEVYRQFTSILSDVYTDYSAITDESDNIISFIFDKLETLPNSVGLSHLRKKDLEKIPEFFHEELGRKYKAAKKMLNDFTGAGRYDVKSLYPNRKWGLMTDREMGAISRSLALSEELLFDTPPYGFAGFESVSLLGIELRPDEIGNILFGYAGKSAGLSDEFIKIYAGVGNKQQWLERKYKERKEKQRNERNSKDLIYESYPYDWNSYFDDPSDQRAISAGITLYNVFGPTNPYDLSEVKSTLCESIMCK